MPESDPSDGTSDVPETPAPDAPPAGGAPRQRLSPVPMNPATRRPDPSLLSPQGRALRASMIDAFNAKKARRFLERQVNHIAVNRDLAEGIKFLFDEHGRPPENAPLEDIVEERRRIEYQIKWFEGILL